MAMQDTSVTGCCDEENKADEEQITIKSEDNDNDKTSSSNLLVDTKQTPRGISSHLLEKFQLLKQRREQITKRSTEKRIKNIQKEVLAKVEESFTSEEDLLILRKHNSNLTLACSSHNINEKKRKCPSDEEPGDGKAEKTESDWQKVRQFIDINHHLEEASCASHKPKSGLEETIDKAVALGDIGVAERLSDKLAERELGTRISAAFDAKSFTEKKKKEEDSKKAKKKKKVEWGFGHKQRWEMKGNM